MKVTTPDYINSGYQFRTHVKYHKYIDFVNNNNQKYKLSNAALEVLSIVAFKQPISKIDIESIRGVDSSGVIKKLLDNKIDQKTLDKLDKLRRKHNEQEKKQNAKSKNCFFISFSYY